MAILLQKRHSVTEQRVVKAVIRSEPGQEIDKREYLTLDAGCCGVRTKQVKHRISWARGAVDVNLPHTTLRYGYCRDGRHLNGMHRQYRQASPKGEASLNGARAALEVARRAYREALAKAWRNGRKIDDGNAADIFGGFEMAEIV